MNNYFYRDIEEMLVTLEQMEKKDPRDLLDLKVTQDHLD